MKCDPNNSNIDAESTAAYFHFKSIHHTQKPQREK